MTRLVGVSITETELDSPFAVNKVLSSRESATPHGRRPTGMLPSTRCVVASTTDTVLARPLVTYTLVPFRDVTTPTGRPFPPSSFTRSVTTFRRASMNDSVPPFSAVTYACRPSRENVAANVSGGRDRRGSQPAWIHGAGKYRAQRAVWIGANRAVAPRPFFQPMLPHVRPHVKPRVRPHTTPACQSGRIGAVITLLTAMLATPAYAHTGEALAPHDLWGAWSCAVAGPSALWLGRRW